jgi:1-acyl-sn-glycerol-3-phosphate acyltransferase
VRRFLLPPVEALFRVLFTYDCLGEEHVPAQGPAVVAANHPSYLDPILLSLQVRRRIHFMAWEALFRVPLLGRVVRAFGAFPVDTRPGHGREAFERARSMLEAGHVVGLFPEGKRSRTAWMEPALREGVARLSLATGAPVVPATITGGFRAWPHFRPLPRLTRIHVRYHPPIDPAPFRAMPEEEGIAGLLAVLRARVERSLLPGVKADLRTEALYHGPPRRLHPFEWAAPLLLGGLVAWRAGLAAAWPALAWLGWLATDATVLPQGRTVKWARTAMPAAALLAWLPSLTRALGLVPPAAPAALAVATAGALLAYVYERRVLAVDVMRGAALAVVLHLLAQAHAPHPAGAHIALPAFLAAFAATRRTVFWRAAVTGLAAYAGGAALMLGPSPRLGVHLAAGLAAAAAVRLAPLRLRSRRAAR